jgi:hypothetical protein
MNDLDFKHQILIPKVLVSVLPNGTTPLYGWDQDKQQVVIIHQRMQLILKN